MCVQCNQRSRAGVCLPKGSIPSQRLWHQTHAKTRYLHRRDAQLPNRSGQHNSVSLCVFFGAYNPLIRNGHRCCSIQRCHHRHRRSDQRCAECWKGSSRHCWHCRILLWQPAHTRSAGINQECLLWRWKCVNNLFVLTYSRLCSPLGVFRRRLGVSLQLCTTTAGGDRGQWWSLWLWQQVWRACSVRLGGILSSENEKCRLQLLIFISVICLFHDLTKPHSWFLTGCPKFVLFFYPSAGFARSFGMRLTNGERREWIKPIMFSGGLGSIEDAHIKKEEAEAGSYPTSAWNAEAIFIHTSMDDSQRLCALLYHQEWKWWRSEGRCTESAWEEAQPRLWRSVRCEKQCQQWSHVVGKLISSSQVQGDNSSDRDLNAVQRGDAEMEQKMNRALRACLERSGGNPICSIHDQGAGGNGRKCAFFSLLNNYI